MEWITTTQILEDLKRSNDALAAIFIILFAVIHRVLKDGVGPYTIQDLRCSCITNWAKRLPVHVVQKLAGHSDIRTTQKYYLSVQTDDIQKAQNVQAKLLEKIPVNNQTDPKVTHSAQKRAFPGKTSL